MIISKTPFRISFFGGGTDFPQWYTKNGGAVLSTTIAQYCRITCRVLPSFFNFKYRVVWSHIETVSTIGEILHPAVREGLKYLGFDESVGLEIHHQGDLPAKTGMGSSSAFVIGLINALMALKGRPVSKKQLALQAIDFEQNVLNESVGCQDQVAIASGGFNYIHFLRNGSFRVDPVVLPMATKEALQSRLMLFYTGGTRNGPSLASQTIANIPKRHQVLMMMRKLVDEATNVLLKGGDLDGFGHLLHKTWKLKRELNANVSNSYIDHVYEAAMQNGALGGKLLGAGGAGFLLLFVPPECQQAVHKALPLCHHVPFQMEERGSVVMKEATKGWASEGSLSEVPVAREINKTPSIV